MDAVVRLGRAAGAGLDAGLVPALMQRLDALGAGAFSSLHYDFTRGKRLELKALEGPGGGPRERRGWRAPARARAGAARPPASALPRYTEPMSTARRFLNYLRPYRPRYLAGVACLVL